jgi:hypothetical protein
MVKKRFRKVRKRKKDFGNMSGLSKAIVFLTYGLLIGDIIGGRKYFPWVVIWTLIAVPLCAIRDMFCLQTETYYEEIPRSKGKK